MEKDRIFHIDEKKVYPMDMAIKLVYTSTYAETDTCLQTFMPTLSPHLLRHSTLFSATHTNLTLMTIASQRNAMRKSKF